MSDDRVRHAAAAPAGVGGHHPIFDRFERTPSFDEPLHHHNFMGARVAHAFEADLFEIGPGGNRPAYLNLKASGRSVAYDAGGTLPSMRSEDYYEWIDLLTAIDRSRGRFVMIEAGAGYGRWIVNAAAAIRRRKEASPLAQRLVALEANRARFEMLVRNCADNGIPASDATLVRAACTRDGRPVFMVADNDYGAKAFSDEQIMAMFDELKSDDIVLRSDDTGQTVRVERIPATRLDHLIDEPVDFIDFDIQGHELEVVPSCIETMDRLVKMVHIGTHSSEIDRRLPEVFRAHGWRQRWGFRCASVNDAPYGAFEFIDGIQSWENPRFDRTAA